MAAAVSVSLHHYFSLSTHLAPLFWEETLLVAECSSLFYSILRQIPVFSLSPLHNEHMFLLFFFFLHFKHCDQIVEGT